MGHALHGALGMSVTEFGAESFEGYLGYLFKPGETYYGIKLREDEITVRNALRYLDSRRGMWGGYGQAARGATDNVSGYASSSVSNSQLEERLFKYFSGIEGSVGVALTATEARQVLSAITWDGFAKGQGPAFFRAGEKAPAPPKRSESRLRLRSLILTLTIALSAGFGSFFGPRYWFERQHWATTIPVMPTSRFAEDFDDRTTLHRLTHRRPSRMGIDIFDFVGADRSLP